MTNTIMTHAVAKAAKHFNMTNSVAMTESKGTKHTVSSTTVGQSSLPPVPVKHVDATNFETEYTLEQKAPQQSLYRVDEIANELKCSLSHVYNMIAQLKPTVIYKDGKKYLYSQAFLDQLKARPRRLHKTTVKVIQRKAQAKADASVTQGVSVENSLDKPLPLLLRISSMEATLAQSAARIESLTQAVAKLTYLLGE